MGKEQRRNADDAALALERGPKNLFSPSRPEIKRIQMMRTDCLGRMNSRPKPADQAGPLADWRSKVKAIALARARQRLAGCFDYLAGIINWRTRAAGAAARGRGVGLVGSGADLAFRICIIASTIVALDRNRGRQNRRIKPRPIVAAAAFKAIGIVLRWARRARSAVLAAGTQPARGMSLAHEGVFRRFEGGHGLIG